MSGKYSAEAAEAIKEQFPDAVLAIKESEAGEITVDIDPAFIVEVCRFCRDTDGLEFSMLADEGGVDYWGYPGHTGPRFGIQYILYSLSLGHHIRLKVYIPEDSPTIESVTGVYPNANWMEREIYDMFGITFENHPDMRRILMPYDWTGYPLRKDYPVGYEEVQFSFNYDRVQKKKPNPRK